MLGWKEVVRDTSEMKPIAMPLTPNSPNEDFQQQVIERLDDLKRSNDRLRQGVERFNDRFSNDHHRFEKARFDRNDPES